MRKLGLCLFTPSMKTRYILLLYGLLLEFSDQMDVF
jgi:hypothetical protein